MKPIRTSEGDALNALQELHGSSIDGTKEKLWNAQGW